MADLRMPDTNLVVIAGRLTRDPELKYTGTGRPYCKVSIANTRKYRTKDGEAREESLFIDGTLWDKFAEYVADKLRKGRPVLIQGALKQNDWEDRDTGQKRSKIELNVNQLSPLDWDGEGQGGDRGGGQRAERAPARTETRATAPAERKPRQIEDPVDEDDILF